MSSRLGHGISRSLVEELSTENAYQVMDEQNEGTVAFPPGSKMTDKKKLHLVNLGFDSMVLLLIQVIICGGFVEIVLFF